jgi:MEDS: MEthanogen/methylotroph, DcmR Sensory domain
MSLLGKLEHWKKSNTDQFWSTVAHGEHVVQIYENDRGFLDLLMGFVTDGLRKDEGVIVIATPAHLKMLDLALREAGFNVFDLKLRDQFIPLDAHQTLEEFMVNGWPDEILFRHILSQLTARVLRNHKKVRAFGEMVSILWSQVATTATTRLENMWSTCCETELMSVFCAYPRSGFTGDVRHDIMHICGSHHKVIANSGTSQSELLFNPISKVDDLTRPFL